MTLDKALLGQLGLGDFTAVDLETTGLNPVSDEIIEFGAVRFVAGQAVEGVSQLICPQHPLPAFITRLTGITQADVQSAPLRAQVLPELLKNWTPGVLVAHNLSFELGFLNASNELFKRERIPVERGLDTLLLARTLLPTLYSHKLGTLVEHLKLPLPNAHRARDDAQAAGQALLALLGLALEREADVLSLLVGLAPPGITRAVFRGLEQLATPAAEEERSDVAVSESNGTALTLDLDDVPVQPLDVEGVVAQLGQDGPLGQMLERFEPRAEQLALTRAIAEAFNRENFLVAEAGTGVGKSFAYLVPCLAWSAANGGAAGRVVLSTQTRTLQDQLFHADIPKLQQGFGADWDVVLLKGRQNYLCLRRMDSLLKRELEPDVRASLMPLVAWLGGTQTGDLEEVHGVWKREVKRWVYDDPEYCVGRRCQFYDRCFSIQARVAAKRAQLVVVNHALLLADLALEGGILGDYGQLIVDEAQHLEKSARQALQRSSSYWLFKSLFDELLRQDDTGREAGLLPNLKRHLPAEEAATLEAIGRLSHGVLELKQDVQALFETLSAEAQPRSREYTVRQRYGKEQIKAWIEPQLELLEQLGRFAEDVASLGQQLQDSAQEKVEELGDALSAQARHLNQLVETLTWLVAGTDEAFVFWYELSTKSGALLSLNAAPLDVGEPLLGLYERLRTAVFTSATLSVNQDFSYFQSRVGLDRLPQSKLVAQDFGQPFDYDEAVHLSVPGFLPPPNDPHFAQALAEMLYEVATYTQKHTMALFTSYKLLREVERVVRPKELFLCVQQSGDSRSKTLQTFRQGPAASLLLGTDSFWEGIDLPGEELEIVVLTKMPFPVPSDPLVAAEEERLTALGQSAFSHYSLPQTILTLRQGFGRLLRSRTDRGAVILADVRVLSKGYGKRVLNALPCEPHTYLTPSRLLHDLKQFFADEP